MKTSTIYKAKMFDLKKKRLRLPNGNDFEMTYIDHPGAVVIVPVLGKDKIALIRQYRAAIGQYIYEVPAGTMEPEQSPLNNAKRELIEETGYKAGKMTLLGKIFPVPGYSTEKEYVYKAEKLTFVGAENEKDEIIRTMVFSRKGIKKMFRSGKIVDAKTISALAMAGWL